MDELEEQATAVVLQLALGAAEFQSSSFNNGLHNSELELHDSFTNYL